MFVDAHRRCPVQPARLADGHGAWVVLGYDAVRHALNDRASPRTWSRRWPATPTWWPRGCRAPRSPATCSTSTLPTTPVASPGRPGVQPVAGRVPRAVGVGRRRGPPRRARRRRTGPTVDLVEGYARAAALPGDRRTARHPARRPAAAPHLVPCPAQRWVGDPPPEAVEASDGIVAYLGDLVDQRRPSRPTTS